MKLLATTIGVVFTIACAVLFAAFIWIVMFRIWCEWTDWHTKVTYTIYAFACICPFGAIGGWWWRDEIKRNETK